MKQQDNMPDWDDLQVLWRQSPALDMDKMARRARFVWWRMRINFALELFFCAFGFGLLVHFMWSNPVMERLIFGGLMTGFLVFGVWAAFWVRAGAWDGADGTALSLVRLQIERARSGIRYARINLWAFAASIPLLSVGVWAKLTENPAPVDTDFAKLAIFCVAYCALALVFWALARGYIRKKTREIGDLKEAEAQLQSAEDA